MTRTSFRPANIPFAGTSLPAMVDLGRELGYKFVGTERFGINAFFVRNELVPERLPLPSLTEVLGTSSVRRSARAIGQHLQPYAHAFNWIQDPPGP